MDQQQTPSFVQITTRIPVEEAELVQTIAAQEKRSLSNLLAIIVAEYCSRKLNGN